VSCKINLSTLKITPSAILYRAPLGHLPIDTYQQPITLNEKTYRRKNEIELFVDFKKNAAVIVLIH
jgi:hypothetical protein